MAFNKIQPQQIQLPTFFSESGNLSFTDNSTGVTVELNETINGGPINFVQGVKSQGSFPIFNSPNTTIYGSTNHSFASSGTSELSGAHNVVVGGSPDLVSGELNVIVNNLGIDMGDFSKSNTIIGGGAVTIDNSITGSVGLFSSAASPNINQNQTVFIGADNGVQILSPTIFSSTSTHQNKSTFDGSAEFNGLVQIDGAAVFTSTSTFNGSSEFNFPVQIDSTSTFNGAAEFNFPVQIDSTSTFNAAAEFNSTIQADAAVVFNNTSTFNGSAEFNSAVQFDAAAVCNSTLTLSDSSEAASRAWVGWRVTQPDGDLINMHNLKAPSVTSSATAISNSQIVTGYLVTGIVSSSENRAHLVVETPFFTGGIRFDYYDANKPT